MTRFLIWVPGFPKGERLFFLFCEIELSGKDTVGAQCKDAMKIRLDSKAPKKKISTLISVVKKILIAYYGIPKRWHRKGEISWSLSHITNQPQL